MSFAIGRTRDQSPIISLKSANYSILDNDNIDTFLVTTGSSANVTMTLPDPAQNNARVIKFVKADSGTKFVEIAPYSTENIRGSNTSIYAIQMGESIELYCDGTDWVLLGEPLRTVSVQLEGNSSSFLNANCTWGTAAGGGTGITDVTYITGVFLASPVPIPIITTYNIALRLTTLASYSGTGFQYRGYTTAAALDNRSATVQVVGKK